MKVKQQALSARLTCWESYYSCKPTSWSGLDLTVQGKSTAEESQKDPASRAGSWVMRTVRQLLMLWDWALVTARPTYRGQVQGGVRERGGPGAIVSSARKPGDPHQVHRVSTSGSTSHQPAGASEAENSRCTPARCPHRSWDSAACCWGNPNRLFCLSQGRAGGNDRPNGEGVGSSSLPR